MKTSKEILDIAEEVADITKNLLRLYYRVKEAQTKKWDMVEKGDFDAASSYSEEETRLLDYMQELQAKQKILVINSLSN